MRKTGKTLEVALQIEQQLNKDKNPFIVSKEYPTNIEKMLQDKGIYCIFEEVWNISEEQYNGFDEWVERRIVGYKIRKMKPKEKQEYLLQKIVEQSEKLGLYEEHRKMGHL